MGHLAGERRQQGGWAGIVMLLLALVVLGLVMRTVLKHMGLPEGSASAVVTGEPVAASRSVGSRAPATASALDRARGVQDRVLEQGARVDGEIDRAQR